MGNILEIDLTSGKVGKKPLEKSFALKYLGGRGFNARRLYDEVAPNVDPLGPNNVLLIGVGPLAGTLAPSSSRFNVTAKSPLTDIFGDSSAGGFFGPELKFAGYDQIVIKGRRPKPTYLFIDDETVQLRDAAHIWGLDTWKAQEILKENLGQSVQCAVIGPAGENLVRYACIVHGLKRAAGRTGMGAVMGSKNLKGIVVRGTNAVEIARPEAFEDSCNEAVEKITSNPYYKTRSELGTPFLMEIMNVRGVLGTRNYASPVWDAAEDIGGERLKKDFTSKMLACFNCPVHCSRFYRVKSGKFKDMTGEGPEFTLTSMVGNKCDIRDYPALLKINNLLNQLGIDCGSFGTMAAWAMDCYDKDILSVKDTGDLELTWGNYDAVIELASRVAYREGFGNILAEGEKIAPKIVGKGSERYMYHVKGMSPVIEDPRGHKFFGLGYLTSTRGGDHLRAYAAGRGLKDDEFRTWQGKGETIKWHEDFCASTDAVGMCKFVTLGIPAVTPDLCAKLTSHCTGVDLDKLSFMAIGERIFNVEKAFNSRQGLTRKDDNFSNSDKVLTEPIIEGPAKGCTFELDLMLDEYYRARRWDVQTGLQSKELLKDLGIEDS